MTMTTITSYDRHLNYSVQRLRALRLFCAVKPMGLGSRHIRSFLALI